MISKELLSEILHKNVISMERYGNIIRYQYTDEDGYDYDDIVNIYELDHICKEWAIKQGYKIRVEAYDYMEDDSFSGTYWWVTRLRPKTWQEEGCPNCGANSTSPEATFKACDYILKELRNMAKHYKKLLNAKLANGC